MGKATDRQVRYAMALLRMAGYGYQFMNSSFVQFGASKDERHGLVVDWLSGMNSDRISRLISDLVDRNGGQSAVSRQIEDYKRRKSA